jgi:hypothetical protein
MAITYAEALTIAYPNLVFSMPDIGAVYENITVISGGTLPDKATLDAWMAANADLSPSLPVSQILQVKTGSFGALSTNATIPYSTSTPAITAGAQAFSASFRPRSATSKIIIRVQLFVAHSATSQRYITGALFRGTTCVRASVLGNVAAVAGVLASIVGNQAGNASMEVVDTPGSVDAITYTFRVGADDSSGTLYINQGASGQTLGSTGAGIYTITEVEG